MTTLNIQEIKISTQSIISGIVLFQLECTISDSLIINDFVIDGGSTIEDATAFDLKGQVTNSITVDNV